MWCGERWRREVCGEAVRTDTMSTRMLTTAGVRPCASVMRVEERPRGTCAVRRGNEFEPSAFGCTRLDGYQCRWARAAGSSLTTPTRRLNDPTLAPATRVGEGCVDLPRRNHVAITRARAHLSALDHEAWRCALCSRLVGPAPSEARYVQLSARGDEQMSIRFICFPAHSTLTLETGRQHFHFFISIRSPPLRGENVPRRDVWHGRCAGLTSMAWDA